MEKNILNTLRKAYDQPDLETMKNQNKNNNEYIKWTPGDYLLYFNKNVNYSDLSYFFKKYNYNVIVSVKNNYICIESKISNDYISIEYIVTDKEYNNDLLEFEEECQKNDPNNTENWKIELENMKKFDSYYMIKATNETEAKFIILLSLYIKKIKGDVLVYDTYNGVYLDSKQLLQMSDELNLYKKALKEIKKTDLVIIVAFFLSGITLPVFGILKMVVPTIISLIVFWICVLAIVILNKISNKNLTKEKSKKIEVEIAVILNALHEIICKKQIGNLTKEQKYLMLRIKDQSISKNCTITNVDQFIERVKERTTTIGYELSIGWILGDQYGDEWEDISKIKVNIDNTNIIKIDYQNEINIKEFEEILSKLELLIKNKYNKEVEINNIIRDKSKPKVEYIDVGILGKYKFNSIDYNAEVDLNNEQYENKIREVLNNYNNNIEEINKKIFCEIYKSLTTTDYKIWDSKGFGIIIDRQKLPQDFDEITDEQKKDVIYITEYTDYNDLWNKIKESKPFWNLNKIKDDTKITNVVINDECGKIVIEFYGIFDFFNAYIEIDYINNFDIITFDPS